MVLIHHRYQPQLRHQYPLAIQSQPVLKVNHVVVVAPQPDLVVNAVEDGVGIVNVSAVAQLPVETVEVMVVGVVVLLLVLQMSNSVRMGPLFQEIQIITVNLGNAQVPGADPAPLYVQVVITDQMMPAIKSSGVLVQNRITIQDL